MKLIIYFWFLKDSEDVEISDHCYFFLGVYKYPLPTLLLEIIIWGHTILF